MAQPASGGRSAEGVGYAPSRTRPFFENPAASDMDDGISVVAEGTLIEAAKYNRRKALRRISEAL